MAGTTLSAVVRVPDLPIGTTITGVELLEVVQTASGVGQSIQIPISQIATSSLGGLPTGGATGQLLSKTSGTNFATGLTNVYVWGPYGSGATFSIWDSINAAGATNATLLYNHLAAQTDQPIDIDCPIINGVWVSVGAGMIATFTFV